MRHASMVRRTSAGKSAPRSTTQPTLRGERAGGAQKMRAPTAVKEPAPPSTSKRGGRLPSSQWISSFCGQWAGRAYVIGAGGKRHR